MYNYAKGNTFDEKLCKTEIIDSVFACLFWKLCILGIAEHLCSYLINEIICIGFTDIILHKFQNNILGDGISGAEAISNYDLHYAFF